MPRPLSAAQRKAIIETVRCADPTARPLVEAQAIGLSDVLKTRTDLQTADTFVARAHDFPTANVLDATGETTEVTLTNAPAGNHLYEAHYKVSIDPVIPGAGTNTHRVEVAIETDASGGGTWVEYWTAVYELITKVGEPDRVVVWPSERLTARVPSLTSSSKLRLKVKSASGPGGWSFQVHGFNLATDGDLLSGVTYHTGPAIDFNENGGGAELADTVISKLSHATSDGFETDLNGPPLSSDAAPFVVARIVWGATDSHDLVIDRIKAPLHPKQDGGQPKDVAYFRLQLYALVNIDLLPPINPFSLTEYLANLVPLGNAVTVPAGDGTSAQDYTFSWHDRVIKGEKGVILGTERKPRPKSVRPTLLPGNQMTEHDSSPTTFVFIWALQADGTPASNVGWARDSAVTEVVNSGRKLRTVRVRKDNNKWAIEGPTSYGATPRPVFRLDVQCGSYAAANLEYTAGGNQLDLGASPTKTVEFVAVDNVPPGCGSVFEVRNDADSAWLPFRDGQTAAEVGVSQREEYKVRWVATPNSQADASPVLFEIGVRDVERVPLWDVATVRGRFRIPDVGELIPEIPEFVITALRTGDADDFADRISTLFAEHYAGDLTFRIWLGDETRDRDSWLHIDDGVIVDDYDPREDAIEIITHSALVFLESALPVYNVTTEKREALVLANKTPKQLWDEIVTNQLGADIPARYRGEGLQDQGVLLSNTLTDSDGFTALQAVAHIAGAVISSSAGKLQAFDMFTPGSIRAFFPSETIHWRSTGPGLRQRVHELFVRYDYREEAQKYEGEARCINGNALLNLKRRGLDAPKYARDAVSRWIPTEPIAVAVGQRRVDTQGTGLLVWPFSSDVARPELRLGDIVAVQTQRFVERDPTQTTLRALKGDLWAIGRIVEHDIEGRELAVWIQSHGDIFGASEIASLRGLVIPDLYEIAANVTQTGVATAVFKANSGRSIKFAVSTSAEPSAATVRAASAQTLDSDGLLRSGTLATLTAGQTLFIAAFAYDGLNGTGRESRLATAKITHYEGSVVLDLVEKSRTAFTITYRATARDPDEDDVRIAYRTQLVSAGPSESYSSPTPTFQPASGHDPEPLGFDIVVDRTFGAGTDRWIEAWAEDANGNRSGILRELVPAISSSDAENAITSFTVSGAFVGSCPSQNLVDTLTWSEGSGVPGAWLARLYACDTLGCTPPTAGAFNNDAASGATRVVASGVQLGATTDHRRNYRIRIENSYGNIIDDDVFGELSDVSDPC